LVEDVEDIDIVYGVDTDGDGVVDVYRRADAVADWNQVVSARISLLVVGPENNVTTNAQTYAFRDTDGDGLPDTQTAPDRRLRQVFSTTISLRNRVM
jgi:type IV pilus assembly protein PilW